MVKAAIAGEFGWQRRIFRVFVFLVGCIIVNSIFVLVNYQYIQNLSPVRNYDSTLFMVEVSSCDVEVVKGASKEVEVKGALGGVKEVITLSGTDTVKMLKVTNSQSCSQLPRMDCYRLCKVTIRVPVAAPPSTLQIWQGKSDEANHVRVAFADVELQDLLVRAAGGNAWDIAGRTLQVDMQGTKVTGSTLISMGDGTVSMQGVDLAGTVDIRGAGSILLSDMPVNDPLSLRWRQPNSRLCVIGQNGDLTVPDPSGRYALCDSAFYKTQFQNYYDPGKDFFLDSTEFGGQLAKMPYCCGSACPHAAWCQGIVDNIFLFDTNSTDASHSSRSGILTASATWDRVKALGLSLFVPKCYRELQVTSPLNNARTPTGWPPAPVQTTTTTSSAALVSVPCLMHSDCITGWCDTSGTPKKCAANPSTVYTLHYSWGACDQVCGGGQQVKTAVCIGSDGIHYPMQLCAVEVKEVRSCNTQACNAPSSQPSVFTISADTNLTENQMTVSANVALPEGATKVRVMLGTENTSLTDQVWESTTCNNQMCSVQVTAALPSYADRLYAVGANSDGDGPATTVTIVDRVGMSTSRTWSLASDAGALRVQLRDESDTCLWSPPEQLTGVRMYYNDAKMLMKSVGPKFGDPHSTDHGVVIIDTEPSPGLPATRWIYATRLVYLVVDPAYLSMYSAGLLTPDIHTYRVRLNDLSCSGAASPGASWDFSSNESEAKLAEIWTQISKSLLSDGWANKDTLRGRLVLLQPGSEVLGLGRDRPKMLVFKEEEEGLVTMAEYDGGKLVTIMDAAIILALVVGLIASLMATIALHKVACKELSNNAMEARKKRSALAAKLGVKAGQTKTDDDDEGTAQSDPFRHPFFCIKVIVINPVRRRLINSLRRFTLTKMEIKSPAPAANAPAAKAADAPAAKEKVDQGPSPPETPACEMKLREIATDVEMGKKDGKDGTAALAGSEGGVSAGDATAPPPVKCWGLEEGAKKQPRPQVCTYMRQFRRRYEEFCIDAGLTATCNRNEIVRSLVSWYNVRVVQETVWRMKGVKWRTNPEAIPMELPEGKDPMLAFCKATLDVTKNSEHWVDFMTRRSQKGALTEGIYARYLTFCDQRGIEPPLKKDLDPNKKGVLYKFACSKGVAFQEVTLMRIPNVVLLDSGAQAINFKVFLVDLISVMVYLFFLLGPPVLGISYITHAQWIHARTMAVDDTLVQVDVVGSWFPYLVYGVTSKDVMLVVRIMAVWQVAYAFLASIRVLLHCAVSVSPYLRKAVAFFDTAFAGFLALEVVGLLTWVGTVASWCVLAAVLDPQRFVGFGAGVLTVVAVGVVICTQMRDAAKKVTKMLQEKVEAQMQSFLRDIMDEAEQKIHDRALDILRLRKRQGQGGTPEPPPTKSDDTTDGFQAYHDEEVNNKKRLTVTDIFELLDSDKSGELSASEFRELFGSSRNKMPADLVEQLFAYCDADGNGVVTGDELEEGWSYVSRQLVERNMGEFGVSFADMVIAVVMSIISLLLLFVFIFLALQGWTGQTDFKATTQAVLVSGSGKVVTHLRKRCPAEGADAGELISELDATGDDDGDGGDGDGG
jgi:hypothetical protein